MNDLIYQKWYFARPALALRIMSLMMDGPGDPLALVGERRIGKTSLLLFELMQLARQQGLLPVYVDVYQHRADPLAAINYALQEAIDDLAVADSTIGRRLKTTIKKIGLASTVLELGDQPSRRRPEDPFLLVDWLIKSLLRIAKKPLLLIFDEIQELAIVSNGENIVSAIRSAITKSKSQVRVVFTGSSQDKLLALFSRSRAALYEGASTMPFPYLGDDFIAHIAQLSKQRFRKHVAVSDLAQAYVRLHHQPRALIDLVLLFSSSDGESLHSLLNERVEMQLTGAQYDALWHSLKPLQQRICLRIAHGGDVTSGEARAAYAAGSEKSEVPAGTVNDALRALVSAHILTKSSQGRGRYRIDDPLYAEWLRREGDVLSGRRKR